eukprot:3861219-Prymnesium_polylepis.1
MRWPEMRGESSRIDPAWLPSPLTAKPGAARLLGSAPIPYLSTLGTEADGDRLGGGEGSAC